MLTVPAIIAGLATLGAPIATALAGIGIGGVPAALLGAGATAAGVGSAATALGAGGAAAANPMIAGGVQAAAFDAYNNAITGSSQLVNGLNLPFIPNVNAR